MEDLEEDMPEFVDFVVDHLWGGGAKARSEKKGEDQKARKDKKTKKKDEKKCR